MSTRNLSNYDKDKIPSARGFRVGIVVAEWNDEITGALLDGAIETLKKHGVFDITVEYVPGSFELIFGSKALAVSGRVDGVIAIGAIIRGETPHFDFIAQGVTYGIAKLNAAVRDNNESAFSIDNLQKTPIIFSVLTTDTYQQAKDRAGGKLGNKGVEGAIALIKMMHLSRKYFG